MRLISIDSELAIEPKDPLDQIKLLAIYVQEIEFHNEIIG